MVFKSLFKHSLIKFLSVGVLNTFLSIVIIFSLKYFANTSDLLANAIGYAVGLSCSFILNKRWTFNHSDRAFSTIPKFLLVFAISYLFNIVTVLSLIKFGSNDYFAHLVGIPIYSVLFYIGSRHFVFVKANKV
jgi:putative flippase GtrA